VAASAYACVFSQWRGTGTFIPSYLADSTLCDPDECWGLRKPVN
jgi:hypothetical protein